MVNNKSAKQDVNKLDMQDACLAVYQVMGYTLFQNDAIEPKIVFVANVSFMSSKLL